LIGAAGQQSEAWPVAGFCALLDHLVGGGQQRFGDGEAERLGGLEVDHQLELGRLRDRHLIGLLSPKDVASINSDLAKHLYDTRSIAHQPASIGKDAIPVDRSDLMPRRKRCDVSATSRKERVGGNYQRINFILHHVSKGLIKLSIGARGKDFGWEPDCTGRGLCFLDGDGGVGS
jgi:hypothetical protein